MEQSFSQVESSEQARVADSDTVCPRIIKPQHCHVVWTVPSSLTEPPDGDTADKLILSTTHEATIPLLSNNSA